MNGISVVVCTCNGSKTIGTALEHISLQQHNNFPLELIVVDNNSNDGTYEYVSRKWEELNNPFRLTLLKEPEKGKFNASLKGFSAAIYDYILICDDDNFLSPNYCSKAYHIMENNSKIGAVGGRGIPLFENEKPEWFDKFSNIFACGHQYKSSGIIDDLSVNLWGAGMVFRKKIWDKIMYLNYIFFLNALRTDNDNSGGDDTELCEIIKYMGSLLYYDETMTFEHFLPFNRTNINFLKKRFKGFGKSRIYLRAYRYCFSNDKLPDENLKIPFWKDILTYRKRELLKYYPRIWFIKEIPDNFEFILKFYALQGEIAEIKKLKDDYINIYKKIFNLKEKLLS